MILEEETFAAFGCYPRDLIYSDHKRIMTPRDNAGKRITRNRYYAKRRKLGYTLLMPFKKGEQGHHITDVYVLGIPAKIHQNLSGSNRKTHRILVLQWLKEHDEIKYKVALWVLAEESLK